MKSKDLLSREWCDLVFENRNKKYGAYQMRAQTGRRYKYAIAFLLSLFLLAAIPSLVVFILEHQPRQKMDDPIKKIVRFEGIKIKEARPVRRPPVKETPQIAQEDKKDITSDMPDKQDLATIDQPELTADQLKKIQDVPLDSLDMLRKERDLQLAKSTEQTTGAIIDSIPRYPGGLANLMKWLDKTVIYPPDCIRRRMQGVVTVAFIVEVDGSIHNPRIMHSAGTQLDHEVLRVVGLMGKWYPGKKCGRPIRSQVTLPVDFELSESPFKH